MHALGHDALPYMREALELDWLRHRCSRSALPRVCATAGRSVFQPAQDDDLRRLDRDPEEHHLRKMILGL